MNRELMSNENTGSSSEIPVEADYACDYIHPDSIALGRENSVKDYIMLGVLFVINLLNYMDRFTIAGVLDDVGIFYTLDESTKGLIQTSFIVSYTVLSPLFGFLGDRYSRKYIIIFGIVLWSGVTLGSSFVGSQHFAVFITMRALVGVGEASYSTLAPTILSDLFCGDKRTKALGLFYFAVPLGSGVGYIIGSAIRDATNNWQWSLRLTPLVGVGCVLLLIFCFTEPRRGRAEGGTHLRNTAWLTDLRQIVRNPSFIFVSLGFTCVSFVLGALSWWSVSYINAGLNVQQGDEHASNAYKVAMLFGAITCVAGIAGVIVGTESGRRLRVRFPRAEAYVGAFGLIVSAPVLLTLLLVTRYSFPLTLVLIFIIETLLCLNWTLVSDITMAVVIPTRRSSACAFQMILSHALGDAGSPYIVGKISDVIKNGYMSGSDATTATYISLQYALLINPFVCVLGGGFFLACSVYLLHDKTKAKRIIDESREHYHAVGRSYEPQDDMADNSTLIPAENNYPSVL